MKLTEAADRCRDAFQSMQQAQQRVKRAEDELRRIEREEYAAAQHLRSSRDDLLAIAFGCEPASVSGDSPLHATSCSTPVTA